MGRGRLITIEGIDGAGKSTLAAALASTLASRSIQVEVVREPGGVELSERIRELLCDPTRQIGGAAEALLYAAARAELVRTRLQPMLDSGTHVLLDRYVDSSLAYQGGGRGLGVQRIAAVNSLATAGLEPDRTLLLRLPPALARARLRARGGGQERLEAEGDGFFARVALTYEQLAAAEPRRIVVLDATARPEEVLELALAALEGLLPGSTR